MTTTAGVRRLATGLARCRTFLLLRDGGLFFGMLRR